METFFSRLIELKGTQSTAAFARSIGIPQPSMDRYLKGRVPTLEVLKLLCSVYNVSADWLLGLPARGGSATESAGEGSAESQGSGRAPARSVDLSTSQPSQLLNLPSGDCSKCKLMSAHIREITGRG